MYFLSGNEVARDAVVEEFLTKGSAEGRAGYSGTLVLFRSERDIPDAEEGIRLHAPRKSGSEPFDPAFDFFASLPTVSEAALEFAGALVTDEDMMTSRDPIWSYNSRMLFANLFSAGVRYWRKIHEAAPDEYSIPSLTDTIFGMLDTLANAKAAGGKKAPSWWRFASDTEREFINTTVLSAPANTAGSLLVVANSYTSNIMKYYSESKCRPLFDENMLDLHVHIGSLNPSMLSVLLRCAHAAWGEGLRVVATGLHSWNRRFSTVLSEFIETSALQNENYLLCGASPNDVVMSVWNGDVAWGAEPTSRSSTLFREKVSETTGNKDGFVISLDVENPSNCAVDECIVLTDVGWKMKKMEETVVDKMTGIGRFKLFHDDGAEGNDRETIELKKAFGLNDRLPGLFESDGVLYIRGGADSDENDDDVALHDEFIFEDFEDDFKDLRDVSENSRGNVDTEPDDGKDGADAGSVRDESAESRKISENTGIVAPWEGEDDMGDWNMLDKMFPDPDRDDDHADTEE